MVSPTTIAEALHPLLDDDEFTAASKQNVGFSDIYDDLIDEVAAADAADNSEGNLENDPTGSIAEALFSGDVNVVEEVAETPVEDPEVARQERLQQLNNSLKAAKTNILAHLIEITNDTLLPGDITLDKAAETIDFVLRWLSDSTTPDDIITMIQERYTLDNEPETVSADAE